MKITGKRAEGFRLRFMYDEGNILYDVYRNPSAAKMQAFNRCREKCMEMGGYNFCILSHNSQIFTVGWITEDENGAHTLHVETAYNSYEMEF